MSDADVKMPEPAVVCDCGGNYYTADQLRAAVLAERERCAKVCEAEHVLESLDTESGHPCDISYNTALRDAAAAIRKGTP